MKIGYKNLALATTILFMPLKSGNGVNTVKTASREIPEMESILDLTQRNHKKTHDFLNRKLFEFKKLEAERKLNYIRMAKPSRSLNVAEKKFTGHPEFLNRFLKGVLKGKGEKFIEAQEKHGINASFLVSLANHESGNGLSDYARNRNNIAGMRNKNGYMYFSSVDECIDKMAENLKKNYIDKGLVTIEKINHKYAESTQWGNQVVERMNPIYDASKCMVYDFSRNK